MKDCKLTKVHCWSFAHGKGPYVANQKVCIEKVCDAVKVTPKQTTSTPGIKTCIEVCPKTDYVLSVKGCANRKNAFLWAQDSNTKKRLICDYVYLPCEKDWVCVKFNTCCASRIEFGVLFTCPNNCDCMILNEVELCRYDNLYKCCY